MQNIIAKTDSTATITKIDEINDSEMGTAIISKQDEGDGAIIDTLHVHSSYRRHGVGRKLLQAAIDAAQEICQRLAGLRRRCPWG